MGHFKKKGLMFLQTVKLPGWLIILGKANIKMIEEGVGHLLFLRK